MTYGIHGCIASCEYFVMMSGNKILNKRTEQRHRIEAQYKDKAETSGYEITKDVTLFPLSRHLQMLTEEIIWSMTRIDYLK